jgi:hypothetical protein
VLASLLPGVRELRAPLVAGYVWLLGLWLLLRHALPEPGRAVGVYKDLVDLDAWAGKPAILVALSGSLRKSFGG